MIKVLITGSRTFQNKSKIRNLLFKIKNQYNTDKLVIASRGDKYGVDKLVKEYSLQFGLQYGEFNPYHENHKLYSIMPDWLFNKSYSPKNFFIRDGHAVKWAKMVIIFVNKEQEITKFSKLAKTNKSKIVRIIIGD